MAKDKIKIILHADLGSVLDSRKRSIIVFVPMIPTLDLVLSLLAFDSFSSFVASSAVADLLVVGGQQLQPLLLAN